MADLGLTEALNDCIDRMAAGQSINDCLRRYPQYATRLRPLLEAGSLVARAQADVFEVDLAQRRARTLIAQRLAEQPPQRTSYARLALIAASLLIVLASVFGAAENALPGDTLYGVKRFGETIRTSTIGMDFGARRVEEIRVLQALRREARVDFNGTVERIDGGSWTVVGLELTVLSGVPGADGVRVGDEVHVEAVTTEQGVLGAERIQLLNASDIPDTPTLLPSATAVPPTSTPPPTTESTMAHTPVPTTTPTLTATLTSTPVPTSTPTHTLTHTPTRTPTTAFTPSPTTCAPTQPNGWVRYIVVSGDTVGVLAALTGANIDQVMAVNCIPASRMIIVGQSLYLPMQPAMTSAPQATTISPPNVPPTDDHGGGSGSDDSGDDHGGGGNSGSGSGNSGSGGGGDD